MPEPGADETRDDGQFADRRLVPVLDRDAIERLRGGVRTAASAGTLDAVDERAVRPATLAVPATVATRPTTATVDAPALDLPPRAIPPAVWVPDPDLDPRSLALQGADHR